MSDVSVIIPTFNSGKNIEQCLTSVDNQSQPCTETIIIDRYSVDKTVQIAKSHGARIFQTNANRSEARNLGAEASRASGILFVDSDMILSSGLVEDCAQHLKTADALVIPEESIGSGYWASCKRLERETYLGSNLVEALRCFRKDKLLSIGGYARGLEAGEDWELRQRSAKNGLVIGRTTSMLVHDEGVYSPSRAFRRKYRYGKTIRSYLKRNPSASLVQVNPIVRVLSPTIRVMSRDMFHGVGVLALRGVEFSAAGLGFVASSIHTRTSLSDQP